MSPKTDPQGFTDAEKAAMKERAKELKAEARASKNREDGENAVLEAIAAMPEPDRGMAARIHEIDVDDQGCIYVGENDHHRRSSYLWSVTP